MTVAVPLPAAPQPRPKITLSCADFQNAGFKSCGNHHYTDLDEPCFCHSDRILEAIELSGYPFCPECWRTNCGGNHFDRQLERSCSNPSIRDFGDVRVELCCFCADELGFEIAGGPGQIPESRWMAAILKCLDEREVRA